MVDPLLPIPAASANDGSKIRLGEKLASLGLISPDQLEVALHEQRQRKKLLGNILVELGFISPDMLATVLSQSTGVEKFVPGAMMLDPEAARMLPKDVAMKYQMLPIAISGDDALVAMVDPQDVLALDQLRRYLPRGAQINAQMGTPSEITEAIDSAYGYEMSIDGILNELQTGKIDLASTANNEVYSHPIVRLVNALFLDAIKQRASDLHFEPEALFVRLRYRIDGVMQQVRAFHREYWPAMSQRIKVLSGMNIADRQNPQDGRCSFNFSGKDVDFRVATMPTVHGENIVIRVLDRSKSLLSLEKLGYTPHNTELLKRLLKRPEGVIAVTGPTGSGKTTTLYSMLNHINNVESNIMTLEDPVEYAIPLIRQSQVREGTGVSFHEGVRALLRQDPDVIFIGEIRDHDTAEMAMRAALTGHKVFTTIHTNDAFGVVPRLLDLGLKPGMLSGNIIGVVAQRLVRLLCKECKKSRPANNEECRILGVDEANPPLLFDKVGCPACRNTGYHGRTSVAEILIFNDELDDIIAHGGSRAELKQAALAQGFHSMLHDGLSRILAGDTNLAALMRSVDITTRL